MRCPLLIAEESGITPTDDSEISSDDEKLIEEFLDDIMGIDPAALPRNQKSPMQGLLITDSGFSFNLDSGQEKNILNSSYLNITSRKSRGSVDFFYNRKRSRINEFLFYLYLDKSRYLDVETDSDLHEVYSRALWKTWINGSNTLGAELTYFDQLSLDTDNAVEEKPLPMYENQETAVAPFWEKELENDKLFSASLEVLSRKTKEPVDDYNRLKLRSYLKKDYGKGSESRVTLEADKSVYTEAVILDLEGYAIDDSTLEIDSASIGFSNHHRWAGKRELALLSKIVFLSQRDNGPGYNDYHYAYLGESFSFRLDTWYFSLAAYYYTYDYLKRKLIKDTVTSETFYQSFLRLYGGIKKTIFEDLTLKFDYRSLSSDSNDPYDQYTSDSIMIGLAWFW